MSLTNISCGVCGIAFCLPSAMYRARRDDGHDFHCPNGHVISYRPSEQDKQIASLEKDLREEERMSTYWRKEWEEVYAAREDLIGVLKTCPFECGWRSRRQIPRDPVAMGRGIERVQTDLREHLLVDHGAVPQPQLALPERT